MWTFKKLKKLIFHHKSCETDVGGFKISRKMFCNIQIPEKCEKVKTEGKKVGKDVKVTFCDTCIPGRK